jgi:spore coat protein U-like protein
VFGFIFLIKLFGEGAVMRRVLICVACFLSFIAPASAATTTANLTVNITITAGCTVTGATLNFGSSSVLASNIDQTTTVGVTCTNAATYNVGMDKGANGASVTARQMKGGASNTEFVDYTLYRDSSRTLNWGNTVGTDTLSGTGTGSTQNITVYGRVPAQATGSAGSYTDTVLITVTY